MGIEAWLRPLVWRGLARFERRWHYDMGYARTLWRLWPPALLRFGRIAALASARTRVPPGLLMAAKVAALRLDDCGPCLQLALDMGAQAGAASADVRALAQGRFDRLGAEAALGFGFADAALRGRIDEAETCRQEIAARFGDRALAELVVTVVAARSFPTLKKLLGHASACQRLEAE